MWTRRYRSCISCQTTDRPHVARGLCARCYLKKYRESPKNSERIKQLKHKWYRKNVTPEIARQRREEKHFGGNRQAALKRDRYRCTECNEDDVNQLTVHHKDGAGRGHSSPNNYLKNLVTLCRACHAREHHSILGWSRNYDCCQSCSTTKRKHNAKGLCWKCYLKKV